MKNKELTPGTSCMQFYDVKSQFQRFVYKRSNEAFKKGDRLRDSISSIEELEVYRTKMRKKFVQCIGGIPLTVSALNSHITGTIRREGFSIEKIIYESRPGVYVTANLYLPDGIKKPCGAVLFLCGHAVEGKQSSVYQTVCQYLVHAGLIVMAQDPIGQGERLSYYERQIDGYTIDGATIEHSYAGCQCLPLGHVITRYFIHDAIRGIDYLCTRPEIDPSRIGVTGSSGGGTQTCLMMLCEPRIAAAAPTNFLMNRRSYMYAGGAQDSEQIWPGFTASGFDHEDFLISMVPRPVLVNAVKSDFFTIEGTRQSVERTRRFWEMYGKENCIQLFEDSSTHRYTENQAKMAAEFFSLYLLGCRKTPDANSIKPLEPSMLWCTLKGQVKKEFKNAGDIHDENCKMLDESTKRRYSRIEPERKKKAVEWLKSRVWKDRKPCSLNPRCFYTGMYQELIVRKYMWWSQEEIMNHALFFRNCRYSTGKLPVTVAIWDGGTDETITHIDWIRKECSSERSVVVLDVTGAGELLPNPVNGNHVMGLFGAIYKLSDDLIWLDDSMAALRTYDVLRLLDLVEFLDDLDSEDISFYAYGRQGLYAQLAAVLNKRVKGIRVVDGMGNYSDWTGSRYYNDFDIKSLILPGVLEHFDMDDINSWLEERWK